MAAKTVIRFLDAHTVDLGDLSLDRLRRRGDYFGFKAGSREKILKASASADVVISNKFYLGPRELARLPRLKLIGIAATGTNNVDLAAAADRGIAVCNVAGYSTTTVVEHALLFLLALSHRVLAHHRAATDGRWSRNKDFAYLKYPYSDLAGRTLGIVGYGSIGKKLARFAGILGMKVLVARMPGRKYAPDRKRLPLDALLAASDFVSLHCPLTEATRALFDAARLKRMKRGACLLNLARGPLVVEAAVAQALRSGRLAAYAADVMGQEPPALSNPLFAKDLAEKVLLTPHVAWASRESRQRLVDEIAANVAAFQSGKRRNRVA